MKTYIVYNKDTFIIIETFCSWGKEIHRLVVNNDNYDWLNTTHPTSKPLLEKINQINKTNF